MIQRISRRQKGGLGSALYKKRARRRKRPDRLNLRILKNRPFKPLAPCFKRGGNFFCIKKSFFLIFQGKRLYNHPAGWSSLAARRAHNPKVAGSNPAPATIFPAFPRPWRVLKLFRFKGFSNADPILNRRGRPLHFSFRAAFAAEAPF